jgi:hypothetical protein
MTEETGEFEAGRDEEIVLVDAELNCLPPSLRQAWNSSSALAGR